MHNSIETFLLNVFGYEKLKNFLNEEIDERRKLKEYLNGTIIGTFEKKHRNCIIAIQNNFPLNRIPMFRTENLNGERKDYEYHLDSAVFFSGYGFEQIGHFLNEKVMPLFPNAILRKEIIKSDITANDKCSWRYILKDSKLNLYIKNNSNLVFVGKQLQLDVKTIDNAVIDEIKSISLYYDNKKQNVEKNYGRNNDKL